MAQQRAVIIGAGPAGLTAALELLRRTKIRPIVLEATDTIGGLSRTVQYKGNRMDIGGHRFFSKSDRVMQWWLDLMPLESDPKTETGAQQLSIRYHGEQRNLAASAAVKSPAGRYPNHVDPDHVMLVRPRKSRIYFLRRFFDYPLRLTPRTLLNLGAFRTCTAGCSYLRAALFPTRVGRLSHQSLRPPVIPLVLRVLHRKSVGRSLPPDQCGVGSTANQGTFLAPPYRAFHQSPHPVEETAYLR
jgi:uncharacterized protein with NAD-binding domain and iron-sulfur cluster